MDSDELRNIEFIDLNGVDEKEQLHIRNSLQQYDPSVQLPWVKEKKLFAEGKYQQKNKEPELSNIQQPVVPSSAHHEHHNPYIQHPIIPQSVYCNHLQPSVVVQPIITIPHPPNIVYYATNAMSPVSPPYPQVFISHRTYSPPTTYALPVHVPEGAINEMVPKQNGVTEDKEIHENGATAIAPEMTPKAPVVVNGIDNIETPSPAPANKSWASLFSSSKPNTSPNTAKETKEKNNSEQAVNKESNNNTQLCPIKHPRKSHQFVDPDCYRMGEYLLSYVIDGKALSLQPRGLLNQSNYCYINSILQALIACPPLYNLLIGLAQNISSNEKRKPTPVIDGMCRFVKEFKHLPPNVRVKDNKKADKNAKKDLNVMINTDIPFEPTWIYKMLNGIRTDLIEGRQEDAEEFLGFLLNGLNDEMLELIKLVKSDFDEPPEAPTQAEDDADKEWKVMGPKNKGSITRRTDFDRTPISDIFGGLLKSRIQRTGDLSTENIQPFLTLQLNIEKVKTVREALEMLVNRHQLEGLTSSKTNEEVEAWQQVLLDELPVILILHLKCFDYKQDGCTKIVKALEFPVDLKIDQKLLSSKTQTQKEKHYKLFAVVYHDGKEASKGHYVTDAFHVGYSSWLRYDDASVKTVQEEQVLKPQGTRVPYLLFYRRSDTIRGK
ncbi:ubiquitin carboxyl-terminal hydrolase 10-B [Diabrotica undecimpunctata]|uniref:ubiquitin carboxyl-terminal hydrolase 10-B n=1 Tax=Diabrotica undecimpunctata TaxID=50387 RepID=UPI003B639AAE